MWYFVRDGRPVGPVDIDSLNESFRAGSLGPTDLVWGPGMNAWERASMVTSLWAEPSAPPLQRASALDESRSRPSFVGPLLKGGGFLCAFLLLYPLYCWVEGHLASSGLRDDNLQARVLLQQPQKFSHRLE